jgi:hypothetical protein
MLRRGGQNMSGTDTEPTSEPNWAALVPVARELQRWISTIPVWSDQSWESWEQFSRRHGKDEQELAKRLRRLPGCTITRSTSGPAITLFLGGVEVRSQRGLTAACADWIGMVQKSALKRRTTIE